MYVCPNRRSGCDTPEIPAEPFTRLVVERVIRAALEGGNTKRVAETVQEDARQRIKEYADAEDILGVSPAPRSVMGHIGPQAASRPFEPEPRNGKTSPTGSGQVHRTLAQTRPVLERHRRHGTYRRIRPRFGYLPASQQHPDHQGHHGHRGR